MTNPQKMPWVVSALLAFGAWLACAFALVLFFREDRLLWLGIVFIGLAYALPRWVSGRRGLGAAFGEQLALAFSLCGKGLVLEGLCWQYRLELGGGFAVATVLAALSYPFFRHPWDRTLSVLGAAGLGLAYLYEITHCPWACMELLSVGVFVAAYALLFVRREWIQPVAWALLGLCLFPVLLLFSNEASPAVFGSFNALFLGAVLCAFYVWKARKPCCVWVAALILLVAYLSNTGTLMGGALVCLGLGQKRRLLTVVGTAAFALSLLWLYYQMQTTLLVKSGYLCGAGVLLLLVYAVLKKGASHAQ